VLCATPMASMKWTRVSLSFEAVVAKPEKALPFVLPGIVDKQVLTRRHQRSSMNHEARRNSYFQPTPSSLCLTKASPCGLPINGPLAGTCLIGWAASKTNEIWTSRGQLRVSSPPDLRAARIWLSHSVPS
jgi:hypothetical protein